jgi:hypothetical protein
MGGIRRLAAVPTAGAVLSLAGGASALPIVVLEAGERYLARPKR